MLRLKPIVGASYTVKFTDRGESDVNKILRGVLYIVFGLLVLVSLLFSCSSSIENTFFELSTHKRTSISDAFECSLWEYMPDCLVGNEKR